MAWICPSINCLVDDLQPFGEIFIHPGCQEGSYDFTSLRAKHQPHIVRCDRPASSHLVEQADSVAHTPGRGSRDELQRRGFHLDAFGVCYRLQAVDNRVDRDAAKLEALAAREDCLGNLVDFCGRQHKDDVLGWFLKCLEQRIKGGGG